MDQHHDEQHREHEDHETAKAAGGGALDGDDFTAEMDASETEADEASGATGGGRVHGE